MIFPIFSNSIKCQVNLDPAQFENNGHEAAKKNFKEIFEFIKNSNDDTIIRGRPGPGNLKFLYTRQGSPVRQFFQRILDWTNGAKTSRIEAKEAINNVIQSLNATDPDAIEIIEKINLIIKEDKDFNTRDLKNAFKILNGLIEKEDSTKNSIENKASKLIVAPEGDAEGSALNTEKDILTVTLKTQENLGADSSGAQPQIGVLGVVVSGNSANKTDETATTAMTATTAKSAPSQKVAENNKSSASPPERRFGGLLVISPNEPVTAGRPLNGIYADAYLFPGKTPDPTFKNSGQIEKEKESNNKNIKKFEQLINYETRSFITMHLESPLEASDALVATLNTAEQLDYLNTLKKIYRESFKLLVDDFKKNGKPLESIALVPISQGHLLADIEVQALITEVQQFLKVPLGRVIQIVTSSPITKSKIENALRASA